MTPHPRRHTRIVAPVVLAAVLLAACDPADDADGTDDTRVATDVGVTEEPCPQATDPDHGCIYLGGLSDLTDGPFTSYGVAATEGQRAFWDRVNRAGGIGGYDVDVDSHLRDTAGDPQQHRDAYAQIEPEVLALAQSIGTESTQAILGQLEEDDVVAVTLSGWSGFDDPGAHHGTVLGVGASDCAIAATGLDWVAATEGEPASVLVVGYPGDLGADAAAGARRWAEANEAEWLGMVETAPNAIVGSQDATVDHLLDVEPDVVVLAVGPAETAELVGAMDERSPPRFLGLAPSWDPQLLDTAAAPLLEAAYRQLAGWSGIDEGDSDAHDAMRAAVGDEPPANDGFVAGWLSSYPLEAALRAAIDAGDLTRAGLRAAVDGVEVDLEGGLPPITLGAVPDSDDRPVTVSAPHPEADLGLEVVASELRLATTEVVDALPCG